MDNLKKLSYTLASIVIAGHAGIGVAAISTTQPTIQPQYSVSKPIQPTYILHQEFVTAQADGTRTLYYSGQYR